ncbi:MAG: FAD-dependent oxidoreductase, partial [Candidatus Kerfeldbacteria bacterium]|nr:FAD-dependent oxidoreductase [Candidatus Kerfeldbacteria bacterium]
LHTRVQRIVKGDDGVFTLHAMRSGEAVEYQAKSVIVTTGVHPRHLHVVGEKELYGKGVTYCTTCDGPLYRKKRTVTIGGGNSALESALMLAELASHATVINIHPEFRGEQVLIDKVLSHPNITVIFNAETKRIEGEMKVSRVVYVDTTTTEERVVECDGVFIHIGMIPNSDLVPEEVKKNNFKEIEVTLKCQTTVPGLFAAGDVTAIPYKQIGIATGQGITATLAAIEYLNGQR